MSCCNPSQKQIKKQSSKKNQRDATAQIHKYQRQIEQLKERIQKGQNENDQKMQQIQLMTRNYQTINQIQDVFKREFENEVIESSKKLTSLISQIQDVKDFTSLSKIGKESPILSFASILKYFGQQVNSHSRIQQDSTIINTLLVQAFQLSITSKICERKTIICTIFYIRQLQNVLENGQSQSTNADFQTFRNTMRENAINLHGKLENVLAIAKEKFKIKKQFHQLYQLLQEAKSNAASKQDIQKIIDNRTTTNSNEQAAEAINQKNTKISELQRKIAQLEREKSNLIDSTELGNSRNRRSEAEEKDRYAEELSQAIRQNKQQLATLEQEKQSQMKKQGELTYEINSLKAKAYLLQGALNEKDLKIAELGSANEGYKQKLEAKEKQITHLEAIIEEQKQQIEKASLEMIVPIAPNIQVKEEAEYKLKIQSEKLRRQVNCLATKIVQKDRQIDQLEETLKRLKFSNEGFFLEVAQHQRKIVQLQQIIRRVNREEHSTTSQPKKEIELLKEENGQLNLKYTEAELKASKLQGEIYELKDIVSKLTRQKKVIEKEKEALQKASEDLKIKNADIERVNFDLKKETANPEKVKGDLEKKNADLQKAKIFLQKQLLEAKQLSKSLQVKLDESKKEEGGKRYRSASFVEHATLFIGDLLEPRKKEKKFLIDKIEEHMGRGIEKSKLLFEFNRDQKTNFHQFIDGHSNLVLIIETKMALFACYYSGIFQQAAMTEEGLILSLDSRKVYKLNNLLNYPNKDPSDTRIIRAMNYDQYYLIFGNAEVRLRSGEKKVYSNFGINNSYFNHQGEKVSSLLKEGKANQVDFVNYEIHEVFFSQDYLLESVQ